jgi:hypothetical protein
MGPAWNLLGCTINYTRSELWKGGQKLLLSEINLTGAAPASGLRIAWAILSESFSIDSMYPKKP